MNNMKYKGYLGSIEIDHEDGILFGKLECIRDLVSYYSDTVGGIETEFRAAVDAYLAHCLEEGVEPDRPYKGSFNVRVEPELHRDLAESAKRKNVSLNEYVSEALRQHNRTTSFTIERAVNAAAQRFASFYLLDSSFTHDPILRPGSILQRTETIELVKAAVRKDATQNITYATMPTKGRMLQ